jgi:ABC-type multidrug transport system fused ATPase/permease subunit
MTKRIKKLLNKNAYVYLFKRTWVYLDANIFLIKNTWKYLGSGKLIFVISIVCGVIAEVVMLSTTYFFGRALNAVQSNGNDGLRELFLFLLLICLARIVFWIFHWVERYLEFMSSCLVRKNLMESLYDKVVHLPLKWHKDNHSGRIINEINISSEGLSQFVMYNFENIEMLVHFVGAIIILTFLGKELGVAAVVIGILLVVSSISFNKRIIRYKKKTIQYENNAAALVQDCLVNITTVISLRIEQLTKLELHKKNEPIVVSEQHRAALNETKWLVNDIGVALMKFLLTFYYAFQIVLRGGQLLVGNISMVFSYLSNIEKAFYTFNKKYSDAVSYKADVEAANHILRDYGLYKKNKLIMDETAIESSWREIKIKNLNFNYKKGSGLRNINIHIKRGDKIAIVGESGSGKSTLLKLLRGLETTEDCKITIDNSKSSHLNNARFLSSIITYVPQEPELFENTIEHNISFGLSATKAELNNVARLACFDDVVNQLPNGFKTKINEKGVNLSGGEKQRLALARGLLFGKNSDIILLDEPTSSVDYKNEIKVYNNILEFFKDKTIISVIHKFYLLEMFDYIYLFDKGEIIAAGTLTELARNNKFQELSYKVSDNSSSNRD